MVPMPFTEEQLKMIIAHFNGFDDKPDIVQNYYDEIIKYGRVDLNPSSALGDGAEIVDIFSRGFMLVMKQYFDIDVDPTMCWWSPVRRNVCTKVHKVYNEKIAESTFLIEEQEADIESNEHVMYVAKNAAGDIVDLRDLDPKCPGNSDDLNKYTQ